MFRNLSLKLKLPIFLTGAFAVVTLVLSVAAYEEVRRATMSATNERLRRVSTQLADLLELSFAGRLTEVRSLAAESALVAVLERPEDPMALAAATQIARDLAATDPVAFVEIRDAEGRRVLVAGDESLVPSRLSPPPGDDAVIGPLVELERGVGSAAAAGIARDSALLGTAAVWRAIQVDSAGRGVLADLLGVDGGIFFGSPGGAWTDLVEVIPPPPLPLGDSAFDASTGLHSYDREGLGRVFAGWQGVGGSPWYVGVELREEDVLAAPRTFLVRLALLGPIALLIVAGSAWVLGRTITASLRETASAAEAIAAGEVGRRVEVRGGDEVGRLAASFNTMAHQIEQSQRALENRNQWLHAILEDAPAPIVTIDLAGNVMLWNEASERVFGFSKKETLGQPLPLLDESGAPLGVAPDDSGQVREVRSYRSDGSPIDLIVARAVTKDVSGAVDGYMLVCEDITSRKVAERQLARYAQELSRSNAELEEFAYVASHDLREPIRMVRSFTQLLSKRYSGKLDEDADRFIGFAVDGAARMESLIRDLLDYSRLDGARRDPAPTSAEAAVQEAVAMLGAAIDESDAEVTHDALPTVLADQDQLMRVFQNLIANAIKFRGDRPPRIHVSAMSDGAQCVFSIRDNGIGIAPEHFERIFVIFKRLHGPQDFGGTGIGLAICKKIVERHGGRIWLESKVGEGSTFHFSMPLAARKVA